MDVEDLLDNRQEILEECLYDSNEDIRKFAERKHMLALTLTY